MKMFQIDSDVQDIEERTPRQDEKHQKGLAPEKGPEYGKPRASSYKCAAKKPSKRHLKLRRGLVCRDSCVSAASWLAWTSYMRRTGHSPCQSHCTPEERENRQGKLSLVHGDERPGRYLPGTSLRSLQCSKTHRASIADNQVEINLHYFYMLRQLITVSPLFLDVQMCCRMISLNNIQ